MTHSQTEKYLSSLNETPKYAKYKHYHWADYIELLCLANLDGEFSDEDLIDRLKERTDLQEGNYNDNDEIKQIQKGTAGTGTKASIDDNLKNYVLDWFKILQQRPYLYQNAYPFVVTEKEIKLQTKITLNHKIYIYLLLCSNLYLFDTKTISILSNSFELLSYEAFKNMLPQTAISHLFGSNPLNRLGRFGTSVSLWDKINRLTEDLFLRLHHDLEETQYPKTNRGDDGLDIVGWIPTGDHVSSTIIFLAQCACRPEEWKQKQATASYNAWANKINFTNYPSNIMFIPFCFRKSNGMWFNISDIHKSILIDRKRIIFYLNKKKNQFLSLPAANVIEKIITTKEGIV